MRLIMKSRMLLYFAVTFFVLLAVAVKAGDLVYIKGISGRDDVSTYSAEELAEQRAKLDAYATASKLAVLKEGGPDEIRFWVSWANFDPDTIGYETQGYVISKQGSWVCRIVYRRKEHSPAGGSCKRSRASRDAKTILSDLEPLSKLSGKSFSCGVVLDGQWMSVDGMFGGQRFMFSSSNPGSCPGEGSKLITNALKHVR